MYVSQRISNGCRTSCALIAVLTAVLFLPLSGRCIVINVPGDFDTIQDAVYTTQDFDTILVGVGEFVGCQVWAGPDVGDFVTLLGSGWPDGTVITGYWENEQMNAIELHDVVGWRITECEFTDCGDAINGLVLEKCEFDHNYMHDMSMAYWSCGCELEILNSSIHHNLIEDAAFAGLMLWGTVTDQIGLQVYNNTIVNTWGYEAIQVREGNPQGCVITNNIISYAGGDAIEFALCQQNDCEVSYNCAFEYLGNPWENFDPGPGNILESPMFLLDEAIPDHYYLTDESPCIDTGNPEEMYNDPDGSRSDMGAFPLGGQPLRLEIAWAEAWPDEPVTLPVSIRSAVGSAVTSVACVISFDDELLTLNSILIPGNSGPDNAGWTFQSNLVPEGIAIALGGTSPLEQNGTLFNLHLTVNPETSPRDTIPVEFVSAFLNGGEQIPLTLNGGVRPPGYLMYGDVNLDRDVDLIDVNLLFDYLAGWEAFNPMQGWLADVSGFMDITPYDGALIIRHAHGQLGLFPVEGGNVDMSAAGRPSLEDTDLHSGSHVRYPLRFTDLDNVSSLHAEIDLTGVPIEAVGVVVPDEGSWFSRLVGTYPHYSLFLGGGEILNGNHSICELEFAIPADEVGDSVGIAITSVLLNEVLITETSNATIRIIDGTEPAGDAIDLPSEFAFQPAYPNPFNTQTSLDFSLPQAGQVDLRIFNTMGQEVAVIVSSTLPAGYYSRTWNANGMASGMYLAILTTAHERHVQRLLLVK